MPRLEHKTVVVTGASNGIGESIATTFAREGAHVVVNYNNSKEKAEYIVKQIKGGGGKAIAIRANVASPNDPHIGNDDGPPGISRPASGSHPGVRCG